MALFSTLNAIMAGGFQPIAVDFNGASNATRTSDFTGLSDSSTGIFMCWVRNDTTSNKIVITNGGGGGFAVALDTTIGISLSASAASINITSSALSTGTWYQILAAWNTNFTSGNRIFQLYINDVANGTVSGDSGGAFQVDYTSGAWAVGSGTSGGQYYDGCMAEMYFAPGQYLDISVSANRRKFIGVDGRPVFLGTTGSLPTGVAPILYLRNPPASFGTNSGTGGDLLVSGTLTACSSSP